MFHHVIAAQLGSTNALTASFLGTVVVGAGALCEAIAGDGDDNIFFGDEVFHRHLSVEGNDGRAALITILFNDFTEFFGDNRALTFGLGQDILQIFNACTQFGVLVQNLLTFQSGQAAQLQSQDRVGLDLVDIEQLHQAASRLVDRGRATNQGNNLIQCIQGLEVTVQDVQTLLSLAQAELRTAHNHIDLVSNPVADKAINRQGSRNTVDQREHVCREVLLQGGALVEVVQNNLRNSVTLQDNHQTLTGTSRSLIANIRDALDLTVAN